MYQVLLWDFQIYPYNPIYIYTLYIYYIILDITSEFNISYIQNHRIPAVNHGQGQVFTGLHQDHVLEVVLPIAAWGP